MKKVLLITAVAALFVGGLVIAQTTVTNRGEVITVHTMTDLPESTETTVYPDARVGDLYVGGSLELTELTEAGTSTATLANAPAAGNPVAWATVVVGTNTYVIPLFAAE